MLIRVIIRSESGEASRNAQDVRTVREMVCSRRRARQDPLQEQESEATVGTDPDSRGWGIVPPRHDCPNEQAFLIKWTVSVHTETVNTAIMLI